MLEYKLLNCYLASPFSIAINISSLATDPSIVCAIAAYATQRYSSCLWQWALTLLMCMLMGLPWRGQLLETKNSPEQAELLFRDGCRHRIMQPGWRWCCILGEHVYMDRGYKAATGHLWVCVYSGQSQMRQAPVCLHICLPYVAQNTDGEIQYRRLHKKSCLQFSGTRNLCWPIYACETLKWVLAFLEKSCYNKMSEKSGCS